MDPSTSNPERAVEHAKSDLKASAKVLGEDLRELRDVIRDAVRDSMEQAKHRATTKYEESERALSEYVREHPVKSLAIAAGVGAFLGLTVLRR